jgi:hypothetical protein
LPLLPRARHEFEHQAEALEVLPHHSARSLRIALLQRTEERSMMGKVARIVKSIVLR